MFGLIRSSCVHSLSVFLLIAGGLPGFAQNAGNGNQPSATEPAQETPGPAQNSRLPIHVVPYGESATPPKAGSKPGGRLSNNGQVQYWGGPVISQVNVVVVHWGNFVNTGSGNMPQFFTDITTTDYFDVLAEF